VVYFLSFFPLLAALAAFTCSSDRIRPWIIPFTAVLHSAGVIAVIFFPQAGSNTSWLVLDPAGKFILSAVSILYLICSFYTVSYLHQRKERPNRVFTASFCAVIGTITLVIWSHHLGLLWIAMEATTLVSAPLIYFNHSKRSIEATWKYLLVGSVGIALALLGTFVLAYAGIKGGLEPTMVLDGFLSGAAAISKPWLHVAIILLIVGYGTKMGLAPMHTWKPDAYGEAPGAAGAIFAGGVTSAAFIALFRVYQIAVSAGEFQFISRILTGMGLFSMAVAAVFMLNQRDFKRMLAYSSVEHMGILAFGLGLGTDALFGTFLHITANMFTKGLLFLSAGNIQRAYESKHTDQVTGAILRLPFSGSLFLTGFFAITGSPPFAPFISEFSILKAAFTSGRYFSAAFFLMFLMIIFIGMGNTVLKVVQGNVPEDVAQKRYRERPGIIWPLFVFLALMLLFGVYIPPAIKEMIYNAAGCLEHII